MVVEIGKRISSYERKKYAITCGRFKPLIFIPEIVEGLSL
jgi:hypothetical protein